MAKSLARCRRVRDGLVVREPWGEELAGDFSFGLIFALLALPGVLLPLCGSTHGRSEEIAGTLFAVVHWVLLGVVSSAVQGVFNAALYRYATTKDVSLGFDSGNLQAAWQLTQ